VRTIAKRAAALVIGASLAAGVAACDALPEIDPSRLPDISLPARPTDTAEPEPAETVTEEAEPAPAETVTEAAEPSPTAEADDADPEDPFVWWPWVLAAVVLVTVVIVWARWLAKRRAWDRRLAAAKAELAWVEDSLVPQVLAKPTAAEAAAQWQSARPRLLDLDRELHELGETAPSDDRRDDADKGLEALRGLAEAVDAEASTQASTTADALRARRAEVDAARARAREWIAPAKR